MPPTLQVDLLDAYLGALVVLLLGVLAVIAVMAHRHYQERQRKHREELQGWYKYTLFLAKRIQRSIDQNQEVQTGDDMEYDAGGQYDMLVYDESPPEDKLRNEMQVRLGSQADELVEHMENMPDDIAPEVVQKIQDTVEECRALERMPTKGTSFTFATGETIDTENDVKEEFVEQAERVEREAQALEGEASFYLD